MRCGERVGDVRARWRGQGMDRIFHRGKTGTERKGRHYALPRRFWGVEVERPVKNVIKMCLELPRGKDVMNIKQTLEAPDAAIYRYMRRFASNRVHAAARLILRRNKRIHSSALNDSTHDDESPQSFWNLPNNNYNPHICQVLNGTDELLDIFQSISFTFVSA